MPVERRWVRAIVGLRRQPNCLPVQRVVVAAVLELFTNRSADAKMHAWVDGHVALIEQAVDVGAKGQAVRNLMFPNDGVRLNVGCLEGRQGALPGNRATATVRIEDDRPETALTEARPHETRIAVRQAGGGERAYA